MLILSRKVNEKIIIGDDVILTIIDTRGEQVKIGIEAPKTVKILRHEVFEAIQSENKAAAASDESLKKLPNLEIHSKG